MTLLSATIPNTTNLISVNVSDSHLASAKTCQVVCEDTSLGIGDLMTIDLGYDGSENRVFRGYVKMRDYNEPEGVYTITGNDVLVRAIDYFMASLDPDTPFTRNNISAEDLVEDLLGEAQLTDYTYEATFFTFGVQNPVEVNLVSVYDFCKLIADTLTWTIWADNSGTVHFENRKPYVQDGLSGQPGDTADSPVASYTIGDILTSSYSRSDRDLRNRIVVYGRGDVSAQASAVSPHLPAGFYKTAVLAWEGLDTQSLAQDSANYNLNMLNRLTESAQISIIGDSERNAREVITVTEPNAGLSGDWYIYAIEHNWGEQGYITSMELRK